MVFLTIFAWWWKDPDREPDPYGTCDYRIRIRIREVPKHTDLDPDLQHCYRHKLKFRLRIVKWSMQILERDVKKNLDLDAN